MLPFGSPGQLRRGMRWKGVDPAKDVDVDGAALLEFKPHTPMKNFSDVAGSQSVPVLEHQLTQQPLQCVVDVQSKQRLVVGEISTRRRRKDAVMQDILPLCGR